MIAEELNVKHLDCTEGPEQDGRVRGRAEPEVAGPEAEGAASEVSKLLEKVDGNELARHLRTKGRVRLAASTLPRAM